MKAITRRIQNLERRFPPNQVQPPGPSASERISAWLEQNGIARAGNESLMEAYARAIGVTVLEIREYFQRRAAGQAAVLAYR